VRYLAKQSDLSLDMQFSSPFKAMTFATAIILSGCATTGLDHRPEVTGEDITNYEIDLKHCQQLAANNKELDATAEGGIAGAASGAIAGVLDDGGSDILGKAVVGAIIGVAGGNFYTKKKQREFIINCMQEFGYNVVADD